MKYVKPVDGKYFICTQDIIGLQRESGIYESTIYKGTFLILTDKGYVLPGRSTNDLRRKLFIEGSEYEKNIKPYDASWINKIKIGYFEDRELSNNFHNFKIALKPFGLKAYMRHLEAVIVEEKINLDSVQLRFIDEVIFLKS